MATYGGVLDVQSRDPYDPVLPPEEVDESPGVLRSFARGVAQSPADIQAMTPSGRQPDLTALALQQAQAGQPQLDPNAPTLADFQAAPSRAEGSRADLLGGLERRGVSLPEPTNGLERIAERVGRTAPIMVAMAPGSFALGGFPALFSEIGADLIATSAGETTAELGGSVTQQIVTEVVFSLFSPGIAVQKIAEVPARAVTAGGKKVLGGFTSISDRIRGIRHSESEVKRIAKKYNVPARKVRAAGRALRELLAKDPAGGQRFIDQAIGKIDEGLRQFPDPNVRPTSRQLLGGEAGQNISSLEEALARSDPGFSATVRGRRMAVEIDLEEQFDNMLPEGTAGGATEAFEDARKLARAEEKAAWNAVPFDQMPTVSTARLKKALADLRGESEAGQKWLPHEANVIDGYGDTIPARELQALRSELLTAQRLGNVVGALEGPSRRGQRVSSLLNAVDEEIARLPRREGSLYEAARSLSRRNAVEFGRKSMAARALAENTAGAKIVSRIRGAKDPAGEARRAIRILDQLPGGADNLRRVFIDDLFEETLGTTNPKRILSKIRVNREMYEGVFGKERLVEIEMLLKKARTSRVGRAGTVAATSATGSGVSPVEVIFAGAEAAVSPAISATARFSGLARRMIRDMSGVGAKERVLHEALLDPELFKTLVSFPTAKDTSKWVDNWTKLVARSRRRLQLSKTAGRAALGDAQTDGGIPQTSSPGQVVLGGQPEGDIPFPNFNR